MNFQIRIRSDDVFEKLDYVKQWIDEAREGFAFEHNKPGNHHFHIYLFGLDRQADPMRKYLFKHLKDKVLYSVKTSAGKPGAKSVPITKNKAWVYASAPDSNPTLVWHKLGQDEFARSLYEAEAAEYYEKKLHPEKFAVPNTVYIEKHIEVKPDKTWEKLVEGMLHDWNKYEGKSVPLIKSMIAVSYLRDLRAVPRPSDLHRYAISLFYITKFNLMNRDKTGQRINREIPDDALVPEYNNGSF